MSEDPADAAAVAAVQAVRRGDRDAFAQVVQLYQRRLFGLVLMVTRDPSTAEEVTQDAFVRAFVRLETYDERRPFYPWIATIAVRLAHTWLVRRPRGESHGGAPPDRTEHVPAAERDPLFELIAADDDRILWRAVAGLSAGERTAVILHYRQEMTVAEIASALGVTRGTVKTFLFRARTKLRQTLGPLLTRVARHA